MSDILPFLETAEDASRKQLVSLCKSAATEVSALRAENERLRDVVRFYAEDDHWDAPYAEPCTAPFSIMDDDMGARARTALNTEGEG